MGIDLLDGGSERFANIPMGSIHSKRQQNKRQGGLSMENENYPQDWKDWMYDQWERETEDEYDYVEEKILEMKYREDYEKD